MREIKEHGYSTYPRRFLSYKWYKPILITLLVVCFFMCFAAVLVVIAAAAAPDRAEFLKNMALGYDGLDVYTFSGAIMNLGGLAILIPSIMIASLIVKDRPFSSYSSSRGGWNWKIFGKMMAVAAVINGIPVGISTIMDGRNSVNKFTVVGFIILTILGPLQCIAEEYLFRGLIMQTVGSWFKLPVIGLLVQIVFFALAHPYNSYGRIAIIVSALGFGVSALLTKGLEASSAVHIANNMTIFYLTGFGFGAVKSEVSPIDIVLDLIIYAVYISFIVFADKKLHWFDEVKKEDVNEFNDKIEQKLMKKANTQAA